MNYFISNVFPFIVFSHSWSLIWMLDFLVWFSNFIRSLTFLSYVLGQGPLLKAQKPSPLQGSGKLKIIYFPSTRTKKPNHLDIFKCPLDNIWVKEEESKLQIDNLKTMKKRKSYRKSYGMRQSWFTGKLITLNAFMVNQKNKKVGKINLHLNNFISKKDQNNHGKKSRKYS